MEFMDVVQIITSGLLGIFIASTLVARKNYQEIFDKYIEARYEIVQLKQKQDLYEMYSSRAVVDQVNRSAVSRKRKPAREKFNGRG